LGAIFFIHFSLRSLYYECSNFLNFVKIFAMKFICVYPRLSASNKNFFFGCGFAALCPLGLKNYKLEDQDELGVRTI